MPEPKMPGKVEGAAGGAARTGGSGHCCQERGTGHGAGDQAGQERCLPLHPLQADTGSVEQEDLFIPSPGSGQHPDNSIRSHLAVLEQENKKHPVSQ